MGFFRSTLLECAARCTQTCLATLAVERLSIFLLGPCFFVASSLVFISICTVPPDPFLSDSFLAFVFWSGLPCSVFAPVSNLAPLRVFPTWHLAYKIRMINSRLCSSPPIVGRSSYRSAHMVPLQVVLLHFHCCFLLGPFLSHAELPAYLSDILTHGTLFSHLFGYLFFLLWFVFWLVAFRQRYYRLVFFDVCFL